MHDSYRTKEIARCELPFGIESSLDRMHLPETTVPIEIPEQGLFCRITPDTMLGKRTTTKGDYRSSPLQNHSLGQKYIIQ